MKPSIQNPQVFARLGSGSRFRPRSSVNNFGPKGIDDVKGGWRDRVQHLLNRVTAGLNRNAEVFAELSLVVRLRLPKRYQGLHLGDVGADDGRGILTNKEAVEREFLGGRVVRRMLDLVGVVLCRGERHARPEQALVDSQREIGFNRALPPARGLTPGQPDQQNQTDTASHMASLRNADSAIGNTP